MKSKKKILITGANGFVGKKIVEFLSDKYDIVGLDMEKSRNVLAANMTDRRSIEKVIKKIKTNGKIYAIIHLSSKLASCDSIEDINIFYDNLKMAENLVLLAKKFRPEKLINFSSMAVYPNIDGRFNEKSMIKTSVNSDCFYGLSKFCSENIIDFMLKDQKTVISHLRIAQIFGEGMRKDRIIPVMMEELKKNNSITLYGDGKRASCFMHVDTLVGIVSKFLNKKIAGVYNIGDKNVTYLELAKTIIKSYGNKKSRIIKKKQGSRVKFYLDSRKFYTCI